MSDIRNPAQPGSNMTHFVSQAPFDPYAIDSVSPALEKIYMASQWRMMWLRFRRHKVAVAAGLVLAVMYAAILVVEFLAPYGQHARNVDYIYAPPQEVHWTHQGEFIGPFVYALDRIGVERRARDIVLERRARHGPSLRRLAWNGGGGHFVAPPWSRIRGSSTASARSEMNIPTTVDRKSVV